MKRFWRAFALTPIFLALAQPIYAQAGPFCNGGKGIDTAIGCVPTDTAGFVSAVLRISIGLGGGFALLLMLYGVYIITTSTGIPDKINQGQEMITSAVSGLVFITISVILLNLIGVKLLAIPGL